MRPIIHSVKIPFLAVAVLTLVASSFGQVAGLTLGGHFIPKDSLMLFIDMGNSAMSGRCKQPDLVTDPHLWKFEMSPANYDWLPAKEPVCVDAYNKLNAPLGGPVMPFLKRLVKNFPGYYFGVMQLSNSGWELIGNFDAPSASVKALLTQANILKANVTIAGIISMLNNVEVQNKDTANYLQHVTDMVNNIRTSLGALQYKGVAYTVPYIHSGYPVLAKDSPDGSIQYDTSHAQTKSIMRQIAQIPTKVACCAIIPTDSLTICMNCTPANYFDHYDSAGCARWGARTGDTLLQRSWIPPNATCTGTAVEPQLGLQHLISATHYVALQKILFDGSNWSVFDKAGKTFSVFAANGRTFTGISSAVLRNQKLLPGVYFVRADVR
jgi:Carbohydrate esterase, sialic acid-specific acetylesterase